MVADISELGLLRLVAQGVAGPRAATPPEAVRRLAAMQGQDFPGAVTAVAIRTAGRRRADVLAALDAGELVRSWPMRGTLHVTAADDLPWLIDLLGPRVLAGAPARRQQLGITDQDVEKARVVALDVLSGGAALRRPDLLAALADGGVDVTGQRGYHLLWYLSQSNTLCLGPTSGTEQLFVLVDEWIRSPRRLDPDAALAELAGRFFRGHGPATLEDLRRWAGLRAAEARAGLAAARDDLACLVVDGVEHFLDPAVPDRLSGCRDEAGGTFLLPAFDEFVLGYADRGAVLDPEFAPRIVPGGNGVFRPTVVHGGRIVGTWQWTGRGAKRRVTATPFTTFPDGVEQAVPELAAALA